MTQATKQTIDESAAQRKPQREAGEPAAAERCPNCDVAVQSHQLEIKMLPSRFTPNRRVSILCTSCRRVYSIVQRKRGMEWVNTGRSMVHSSGALFNRLMEKHRQFTGE